MLNGPGMAGLLDFNQPVAVLAVAVLHFVPDAKDPAAILDAYCRAVPSGSYLAVSHTTDHYDTPEKVVEIDRGRRTNRLPGGLGPRRVSAHPSQNNS
ncbi:SAM-dependent methyltransferase [Saccharopolyspora aridisoli]|uniref:SAM-dependent methyltransferase n=1 Tax=Saccharopolyspora aridisoli TaxID=2530385 RepID=UPI001F30984E|nr:SAM-dependent methyltransferase [Saccharopolyspora aridisoli]